MKTVRWLVATSGILSSKLDEAVIYLMMEAGLGRQLIKPQNSSNQLKTALMDKNSSTAQNGLKMIVAMAEMAARANERGNRTTLY